MGELRQGTAEHTADGIDTEDLSILSCATVSNDPMLVSAARYPEPTLTGVHTLEVKVCTAETSFQVLINTVSRGSHTGLGANTSVEMAGKSRLLLRCTVHP